MTDRLPNLDVLRGLAALLVLLGHAYALGGRGVPLAAESLVDLAAMATTSGVWLFFAISALVIGRPWVRSLLAGSPLPDTRGYLTRRGCRIYPLHLVCLLAVLLLVGRLGSTVPELLAHVLLVHNLVPDRQQAIIAVAWTLTIEVLFYASVPLAAVMIRRRWRGPVDPGRLAWLLTGAAVASTGLLAVGVLVSESEPRLGLYLRLVLPSLLWAFVPGLLLAIALEAPGSRAFPLRVVDRIRHHGSFALAVGGGGLLVAVGGSFGQLDWGLRSLLAVFDASRIGWSVAYSVVLIRCVDRAVLERRAGEVGRRLGEWSYGIYLIHGTLVAMLAPGRLDELIPLARGGLDAFVVHVLFLGGLTLPLAWLSWTYLERPFVRWSQRARPVVATVALP